ncbi:unnamed protein product [Nippostrongylus brasiliensis]|uniref:Col_cuticle_N domain-containing protein n=1 Tax=Nippostrongylus brasiliensis TaxID=27835 RepID=A0A0N4YIP7_NIPBR|nr:unnamed protein product [Nippostrongylus brasiliensis]
MMSLQCRIRDAIVTISSASRGYMWRTANVTLQLALVGTVVFTTMTLIFAATLSESTLDNDFFELLRAKYGSPRNL